MVLAAEGRAAGSSTMSSQHLQISLQQHAEKD